MDELEEYFSPERWEEKKSVLTPAENILDLPIDNEEKEKLITHTLQNKDDKEVRLRKKQILLNMFRVATILFFIALVRQTKICIIQKSNICFETPLTFIFLGLFLATAYFSFLKIPLEMYRLRKEEKKEDND